MIELGIAERDNNDTRVLEINIQPADLHAIEVRVYSENPFENFKPCPGVLQLVDLREDAGYDWLRVETWVCYESPVLYHVAHHRYDSPGDYWNFNISSL